MKLIYPLLVFVFILSQSLQNSLANQSHNSLKKYNIVERMAFWNVYMKQIGETCIVGEDYFMGFDKDKAAYWSVDCNGNKANGYLIQLPNDTKSKTKHFSCKVAKMLNINCFTKLN